MDEITLTGKTRVAELKDGKISEYDIRPEDFGIETRRNLDEIKVANTQESLLKMNEVLEGREGAARDIVLLNTAAALYAGNIAASLSDGISAHGKPSIQVGPNRKKRSLSGLRGNLPKQAE